MNIISALFWAVLYISFVVNGLLTQEGNTYHLQIGVTFIYSLIVATFAFSAYVIRFENRARLKSLAEGLNYSLLLAVLIQYIYFFNLFPPQRYQFNADSLPYLVGFPLFEVLFFVGPALANILALSTKSTE